MMGASPGTMTAPPLLTPCPPSTSPARIEVQRGDWISKTAKNDDGIAIFIAMIDHMMDNGGWDKTFAHNLMTVKLKAFHQSAFEPNNGVLNR
jgi:hypothetical protein